MKVIRRSYLWGKSVPGVCQNTTSTTSWCQPRCLESLWKVMSVWECGFLIFEPENRVEECRQRCRVALELSTQKSFVEMVSGGLQWKVEEGLKRLCFEQILNSACHWPASYPQCKGSITRETCSRYTNMHVLGSSLFLNTRRFLHWARIQAESSLGLAVELFLAWIFRKTLQ